MRALLLSPFLVACSGLHHARHDEVPRPASIAVLPVGGDAALPVRELARGLLGARLAEHGFLVAEFDVVDQRLAECGWLADPEAFAPGAVAPTAVAHAIGVDAVLLVDDCSETRWNAVLVRRHALSARARIVTQDGREWWRAEDTVGSTGGLLLESGQLLTALGGLGVHGAGAVSVDRVDELTTDFASTWPVATMAATTGMAAATPRVRRAEIVRSADGERRLVVEAEIASATAVAVVEIGDATIGVPMAGAGVRTAAVDLLPTSASGPVRVRARTAFGPATASEFLEVQK